MKTPVALTLAGALAATSMTAMAQPGWRQYHEFDAPQRARVVQVDPIIRTVRVAIPQTDCYQRPVHHLEPVRRDNGAALVGGIVGGIIGHNLDNGRGGASVAGAIVGAAVGSSMAHSRDGYYDTISYQTRCYDRTRYQTREQLMGYRVTYRYHGRFYMTRMDHRPGKFIRVNAFYPEDDD